MTKQDQLASCLREACTVSGSLAVTDSSEGKGARGLPDTPLAHKLIEEKRRVEQELARARERGYWLQQEIDRNFYQAGDCERHGDYLETERLRNTAYGQQDELATLRRKIEGLETGLMDLQGKEHALLSSATQVRDRYPPHDRSGDIASELAKQMMLHPKISREDQPEDNLSSTDTLKRKTALVSGMVDTPPDEPVAFDTLPPLLRKKVELANELLAKDSAKSAGETCGADILSELQHVKESRTHSENPFTLPILVDERRELGLGEIGGYNATRGKIVLNKEFLQNAPVEEIAAVLGHEYVHCCLKEAGLDYASSECVSEHHDLAGWLEGKPGAKACAYCVQGTDNELSAWMAEGDLRRHLGLADSEPELSEDAAVFKAIEEGEGREALAMRLKDIGYNYVLTSDDYSEFLQNPKAYIESHGIDSAGESAAEKAHRVEVSGSGRTEDGTTGEPEPVVVIPSYSDEDIEIREVYHGPGKTHGGDVGDLQVVNPETGDVVAKDHTQPPSVLEDGVSIDREHTDAESRARELGGEHDLRPGDSPDGLHNEHDLRNPPGEEPVADETRQFGGEGDLRPGSSPDALNNEHDVKGPLGEEPVEEFEATRARDESTPPTAQEGKVRWVDSAQASAEDASGETNTQEAQPQPARLDAAGAATPQVSEPVEAPSDLPPPPDTSAETPETTGEPVETPSDLPPPPEFGDTHPVDAYDAPVEPPSDLPSPPEPIAAPVESVSPKVSAQVESSATETSTTEQSSASSTAGGGSSSSGSGSESRES